MRILFITDHKDINKIKNNLRDLCEPSSVVILNNFDLAFNFINNEIVNEQQSLDLIICTDTVKVRSANDIRDFIRQDELRTFSNRDFRLNSIPLVLLNPSDNVNLYNKYDLVIESVDLNNLYTVNNDFKKPIKNWRRNVLEELKYLGFKKNTGIRDYILYLKNHSFEFKEIKIIAPNFIDFPRRLDYYWIHYDKYQIEKSIDDFIKLLKRSELLGKKGEEKKFHKFFNKNELFLKRDAYSKIWYESRLYKDESKFESPDYALKPNFTFETDLSILEVKLPNELLVKKEKFHQSLRSKFIRHIFQVNDYKDYLESDNFLSEIEKIYGFVPQKINYNLLIGRQSHKDENMDILTKRLGQMNQKHLTIMSYDEILEYQVRFFERMELLDIN